MPLIALLSILLLGATSFAADAKSCDPPCPSGQQCYNGRCQATGAKPVKPKPLPRKPAARS